MSSSLPAAWKITVATRPGRLALATAQDGRTWSVAQLDTAAKDWAGQIPAPARLAGRRVALCAPNGADWWRAFLGLLELTAVPIIIDATEPVGKRREIASATRAVALWADGELHALPGSGRKEKPDACLIKLTSGSTGTPKAWAFTHGQMLADGRQVCSTMGLRPDDLNLAAIPLGHSYGLGNLVLPLILQGTGMVLVDSPLPNVLAAAADRWRPSVFPAVPSLLDALVRSNVAPDQLSTLRLVISAGAALPAPLARDFFARYRRKVHNFYGASETGGISYDRSGDATLSGRSVGQPLDGVTLHWRGGRRFTVTSAAVKGAGTFSPLDLGVLNEHGELVLSGRAGRIVKLGARRVDLGEVEAAIRSLAGVRGAHAAVSLRGRPAILALVATDLGKDLLRARLTEILPLWKIPHGLVTVASLPVNARGKLDREAANALLQC